jgi:hypothetical protein
LPFNDNGDLFHVVAFDLHHRPGKGDPRRWRCKQSHNAAARVEKIEAVTIASADADAEECRAGHNGHEGGKKGNLNRHEGKKKETLEVSGGTNGANMGG